ncbi:unnamed protein product [Pleuronectes platessa]|uniref:Uncharacterized protein n=1 Tax=Pleuronectes platessa TaxID=8262 RepID=A0A9N7YPX9_PLEPL|nr:unnamed protein product [Pleuronectes platessa]
MAHQATVLQQNLFGAAGSPKTRSGFHKRVSGWTHGCAAFLHLSCTSEVWHGVAHPGAKCQRASPRSISLQPGLFHSVQDLASGSPQGLGLPCLHGWQVWHERDSTPTSPRRDT